MLAQVPQEIDCGHVTKPVKIINHSDWVTPAEVQERTDLCFDRFNVFSGKLFSLQGSFRCRARIANHSRCSTNQTQHVVPSFL